MNVHTAPTGLRQPSTVKDSGDTLHREGVGDFLKSHHRPSVVVSENGWGAAGALARTTAPPQQRSSRQSIDHRGVAGEVALLVWWEGDAERGARGTPCFLRRAGRAWRCGTPPPPRPAPFPIGPRHRAPWCTVDTFAAAEVARAQPCSWRGHPPARALPASLNCPAILLVWYSSPLLALVARGRGLTPASCSSPTPVPLRPTVLLLSPPPCPPSFRLAFIS